MNSFFNWLSNILSNFANAIIQLLPHSPFRQFIDSWAPPAQYMGWLNWFFPVSELLTVIGIWLAAVALFYLYSIIMRWIKMIGN